MADGIPNWTVTGSVPYTDFVPGQGPVEGYKFTFITDTSITGTVFVPTTDISNTARVRDIIVARVTALNDLHGLTG